MAEKMTAMPDYEALIVRAGFMRRRKARSFEVSRAANDVFLKNMKQRVNRSIFVNGNCAGSNSYYFNQHGEATLLRPTSTVAAFWQAGHFPLRDYCFE